MSVPSSRQIHRLLCSPPASLLVPPPRHLFKSQIQSFTPSLKCFVFSKKTKSGPEWMTPTCVPNFPVDAVPQPSWLPVTLCPQQASFSHVRLFLLCIHQVHSSSSRSQLKLRVFLASLTRLCLPLKFFIACVPVLHSPCLPAVWRLSVFTSAS